MKIQTESDQQYIVLGLNQTSLYILYSALEMSQHIRDVL